VRQSFKNLQQQRKYRLYRVPRLLYTTDIIETYMYERYSMISKRSRLTIASALLLSSMQLFADTPVNIDSLLENAEHPELIEQAKRTMRTLDFALEELAQAVHTGAAKAPDKNAAREEIRKVRDIIAQSLNPATKTLGEVPLTLPAFVQLNKALITHTSELVSKNFKDLGNFDTTQAVRSLTNLPILDPQQAKDMLETQEETIKLVRGYVKEAGLTPVNRATRNLEQFDTNWNITNVLKRAFPYFVLGTYCVAVTSEDDLPEWQWLRTYKGILGIIPRISEKWIARNSISKEKKNEKDAPKKPQPNKGAAPQPPVNNNTASQPPLSNGTAPQPPLNNDAAPQPPMNNGVPQETQQDTAPKHVHFKESNSTAHPEQDTRSKTTFPNATEFSKEPDITPGKGLIGKPLSKAYSFFTYGKEGSGLFHLSNQPIITLTLAAVFGDKVKKDIKDLWGWSSKQVKRAYASLKGESFDDGSIAKESKVAFKDIIGQEHAKAQLTKVVNYFKDKESLDRSGALIGRGYLLVGALDSAKMLAQGVAKEITEQLKAQQKNKKCKIYEIHASDLVTKEFKSVFKEAEKVAPCILLVNELDWLCAQDNVMAETWGEIVKTINGIATSKKEVFVIATAQSRFPIDKVLGSAERLGTVIISEMPTLEDRKAFFEKELQNRCINRSLFDIAHLAHETDKCTNTQLGCLVKRALALAYTEEETLKPQHLEQSINEVVHGIKTYEPTQSEKQKLAAYYAGKALAHKLILPHNKLIKVTILPVDTQMGTYHGKLITYKEPTQEMLATETDIKDTCIVELAGIEAQRILLQSPVQASASTSIKKVVTDLKKIVFEGVDEIDFSQEQREKKKTLIEENLKALQSKARALLEANKDQLQRLARALEDKLVLTAQEIEDILA
jgi:cell division protease FtsH